MTATRARKTKTRKASAPKLTAAKQKRLEADGWRFGDAADFLQLTDAERELVEIRLSLAREVKAIRQAQQLSQTAFGELVGSSQSRVAKMEAADKSVSVDLLVKTLTKAGASRKEIGKTLAK